MGAEKSATPAEISVLAGTWRKPGAADTTPVVGSPEGGPGAPIVGEGMRMVKAPSECSHLSRFSSASAHARRQSAYVSSAPFSSSSDAPFSSTPDAPHALRRRAGPAKETVFQTESCMRPKTAHVPLKQSPSDAQLADKTALVTHSHKPRPIGKGRSGEWCQVGWLKQRLQGPKGQDLLAISRHVAKSGVHTNASIPRSGQLSLPPSSEAAPAQNKAISNSKVTSASPPLEEPSLEKPAMASKVTSVRQKKDSSAQGQKAVEHQPGPEGEGDKDKETQEEKEKAGEADPGSPASIPEGQIPPGCGFPMAGPRMPAAAARPTSSGARRWAMATAMKGVSPKVLASTPASGLVATQASQAPAQAAQAAAPGVPPQKPVSRNQVQGPLQGHAGAAQGAPRLQAQAPSPVTQAEPHMWLFSTFQRPLSRGSSRGKSQGQAQPQAQPQSQRQPQPQPQYQTQPKPQRQPQAQYQTQPHPQRQPQAQFQNQPQPQRQSRAQYQTQYQTQPPHQRQAQAYPAAPVVVRPNPSHPAKAPRTQETGREFVNAGTRPGHTQGRAVGAPASFEPISSFGNFRRAPPPAPATAPAARQREFEVTKGQGLFYGVPTAGYPAAAPSAHRQAPSSFNRAAAPGPAYYVQVA